MKKRIENNPSQDVTIFPFQPEDQSEVKALILAGLAEHWGTLDPNMNPDLNDISQTYAKAVFLVARLNNKIVGTGALIPKSDGTAEVVRMSVATDFRRKGIGRKILLRMFEHTRSNGYKRLVLETTDTWQEVIEFYKRFGFHITHYLDGDVYFVLDIPEVSK
jgi:ribosomal protein S18 acetylase RimI-like enzyme